MTATNGLPIRFLDRGPIGDKSRGRIVDAVIDWKGSPMVLITFYGYHRRFEDRFLTLYPHRVHHPKYMVAEKIKLDLSRLETKK